MTAYVFSGSGTRLVAHAGAFSVLSRSGYQPSAVGGASGGGIVALGIAAGLDLFGFCESMLTQDLLDISFWPFDRYGLYKGDKIHKLLRQAFGNKRMKDLKLDTRVVVANLNTRSRQVVHKEIAPGALLADVSRCTMAIPAAFKAAKLYPNDATLYVDGGTVDNFPLGIFDDLPQLTIGIRFKDSFIDPKPVRSLWDYAVALFDLRQDAANNFTPSTKPSTQIIEIKTQQDGMNFSLTKKDVEKCWVDGEKAASEWLRTQIKLVP